jgi:AcrR family transcriptional regulator
MSSRETQRLILDSALRLFNQHGSPNVSTNRIAEDCGISKGNLNYHFRTKQEIVLTLFWQMSQETLAETQHDDDSPEDRLAGLFAKQLAIAWRYRFFIREAAALLREQSILRRRFSELRRRNGAEWRRVLNDLSANGRLKPLPPESETELLMGAIFVHCDHWLHFVETQDEEIDESSFMHGYETLLLLLGSYATDSGAKQLRRHAMIEHAARQFAAQIAPNPVSGRQRNGIMPPAVAGVSIPVQIGPM